MGKSKELAELGDVFTQSGGNVGIGESSPARNLVVKDSTMASIALQTDASGVTLTDGFQLQADSNDAYVWNYENTDMLLGTNNTTRMTIDASGRVTMPYQPAFYAHNGTNTAVGAGDGKIIVLDTAPTNVGSNYNTSNGRFTAPVAGNYFFTGSMRLDGANVSYFRLRIKKNGNQSYAQPHSIYDLGGIGGPAYFSMTTSGVITLNASDFVELIVDVNSDTSVTLYRSESSFSGYLIG